MVPGLLTAFAKGDTGSRWKRPPCGVSQLAGPAAGGTAGDRGSRARGGLGRGGRRGGGQGVRDTRRTGGCCSGQPLECAPCGVVAAGGTRAVLLESLCSVRVVYIGYWSDRTFQRCMGCMVCSSASLFLSLSPSLSHPHSLTLSHTHTLHLRKQCALQLCCVRRAPRQVVGREELGVPRLQLRERLRARAAPALVLGTRRLQRVKRLREGEVEERK